MEELQALLEKAQKLNDEKKYDETIALLPKEVLEKYNSADLYAEKTEAYYYTGNVEDCHRNVNLALDLDEKHAKANIILGILLLERHDFDSAIVAFTKAIEAKSEYALAYFGLGNAYQNLKQYDNAIKNYQKAIEIDEYYLDACNSLGIVYGELKQYDNAIETFSRVIELDEYYLESYNNLGVVYGNLNQYDKAIEIFNRAIKLDEKYISVYNNLGNVYKKSKDYEKAIESYKKAIYLDKTNATYYNNLGSTYVDMKQYDDAIDNYRIAIEYNDNYDAVYYNLGNVYAKLKQYNEAIENYQKATQLNNELFFVYNNLGIVYRKLKKFDEAIENFHKAIDIDENYANTYFNLGVLNEQIDELEKAKQNFEKFLQLDNSEDKFLSSIAKSIIENLNANIKYPIRKEIYKLVEQVKHILRFEGTEIVHYTSLAAMKEMVFNGSKLRFSEGTFLNDSSEGTELFKFLSIKEGNRPEIKNQHVKKPFVGSFVDKGKCDDLTMWRMYGKESLEEAKGCSLTIDRNKLIDALKERWKNGKSDSFAPELLDDFSFYKVVYITQTGDAELVLPDVKDKDKIDDLTKKLNDLKDKVAEFESKKVNDTKLEADILGLLNSIAFLFKSAEYQYEHEVRLVLDGVGFEKKIDAGMLPPRVYIELADITPTIKKITLGPKVGRKDEWIAALYHNYENKKIKQPEYHKSELPYK